MDSTLHLSWPGTMGWTHQRRPRSRACQWIHCCSGASSCLACPLQAVVPCQELPAKSVARHLFQIALVHQVHLHADISIGNLQCWRVVCLCVTQLSSLTCRVHLHMAPYCVPLIRLWLEKVFRNHWLAIGTVLTGEYFIGIFKVVSTPMLFEHVIHISHQFSSFTVD